MWRLPDDDTKAVITAAEQIHCANRKCSLRLPETAIVFFMSKGTDYLAEHYHGEENVSAVPTVPEPMSNLGNQGIESLFFEWRMWRSSSSRYRRNSGGVGV